MFFSIGFKLIFFSLILIFIEIILYKYTGFKYRFLILNIWFFTSRREH